MEGLSVRWGDAFCQSLSLFFAAVLSCRNFCSCLLLFSSADFFCFPVLFISLLTLFLLSGFHACLRSLLAAARRRGSAFSSVMNFIMEEL